MRHTKLTSCCHWPTVVAGQLLSLTSCCRWPAVVTDQLLSLTSCYRWPGVVADQLLSVTSCCCWPAVVSDQGLYRNHLWSMVSPRVQEACPPLAFLGRVRCPESSTTMCSFFPSRHSCSTSACFTLTDPDEGQGLWQHQSPHPLPSWERPAHRLCREWALPPATCGEEALNWPRALPLPCARSGDLGSTALSLWEQRQLSVGSSPSQKPPHTREISFEVRFHKRVPPISDAY